MAVILYVAISLVLGIGFPLEAQDQAYQLIQPARDRSGAILQSQIGRAYLRTPDTGRQRRLPLRRNELLSTVAEIEGGWMVAGATSDSRKLVVISVAGSGARRLDSPAGGGSRFRLAPRILSNETPAPALAWLEGPDLKSLSIRISNLRSSGWSETTSMPSRLRGGQTGLTVAPLHDGSYLMVWAEFDGNDDDLMYSILNGETHSRPARVGPDNRSPDVMPSLIDTPEGALLAWNQLDNGDYRIKIRKFEGSIWGRARTHGPPGALRPQLRRRDDSLQMLYREAWPRRWTVAELGPSGRAERRASIAADSQHPPALLAVDDGAIVLKWSETEFHSAPWRRVP